MKNILLGLKLGSIDIQYMDIIFDFYDKKFFSYIELFALPNTYKKYAKIWKNIKIPFIIHGPHFATGLNFADSGKKKENAKLAYEAIKFCDMLDCDSIIFHPGVGGNVKESINQINSIKDSRMVIENKPFVSIDGLHFCRGSTFSEINQILNETSLRFCLDFGHAINSANYQKINQFAFINSLLNLKPSIFHLTDGFFYGIHDTHEHYGEGNFPLKELFDLIPDFSKVTNEAKKKSENNLDDFLRDVKYLNEINVRII